MGKQQKVTVGESCSLKLSALAGHGCKVLHAFTPNDSLCSVGAFFYPAFSIVNKVREKLLQSYYCLLNTSDLFFGIPVSIKGAVNVGFFGVGINLGKLLSLTSALCAMMSPVNDFIMEYFCRKVLFRYVYKLL